MGLVCADAAMGPQRRRDRHVAAEVSQQGGVHRRVVGDLGEAHPHGEMRRAGRRIGVAAVSAVDHPQGAAGDPHVAVRGLAGRSRRRLGLVADQVRRAGVEQQAAEGAGAPALDHGAAQGAEGAPAGHLVELDRRWHRGADRPAEDHRRMHDTPPGGVATACHDALGEQLAALGQRPLPVRVQRRAPGTVAVVAHVEQRHEVGGVAPVGKRHRRRLVVDRAGRVVDLDGRVVAEQQMPLGRAGAGFEDSGFEHCGVGSGHVGGGEPQLRRPVVEVDADRGPGVGHRLAAPAGGDAVGQRHGHELTLDHRC